MITAIATRREGRLAHDVTVDGHSFLVDEPEDVGGADEGPSPTRLLAASLAACTSITIAMYAERKGWELPGLAVRADYEGTPKPGEPARFALTLELPGGLSDEQRRRIHTIAAKCPVHRTIVGEVEITIRDSSAPA